MEVNTDNIFQVQCAKYCLIQMNMWEFYALLAKNVSVLDDNPRAGFGSLAANVSLNLCQKCVKSHKEIKASTFTHLSIIQILQP